MDDFLPSSTITTTNNPNLDLFIQLVRDFDKNKLKDFLDKSWEFDKIKTIAIIFNARDRISGKKEKAISNDCLLWLKDTHFDVYKKNIKTYINKYGCWNDLNYIIKKTDKKNYEYSLFAEQLKEDKQNLENGENVSLCSKWVISPNDKNVIKIARYLFNNENIQKYQERYRKEYISPLRSKLNLVETKMCHKDWEAIEYEKIPAKALKKYKKAFMKNDEEKYKAFIENVSNNKIKLKITGLLPHEIIKSYMDNRLTYDETIENEWNAFVNLFENKEFEGIIPIVDVSGSMFDSTFKVKPIYVSLALGLLLSHINKDYLHNKVITFSNNPQFFNITGTSLCDRLKSLMRCDFGLNTDFLKVADLLIENNLVSYKKIICFTDMQFDKSSDDDMKTIHEKFIKKFTDKNLNVPELIYWNLNGTYNNIPIDNTYQNTSIISGFSEQLLNIILDNTDKITPEILMENCLKPYYPHILI
jgi:hypothetical protein